MTTRVQLGIAAVVLIGSPLFAVAVSPTPGEMAECRRWAAAKFEGLAEKQEKGYGAEPFFSFMYDGRPSSQLLGKWKVERRSKDLDAHRTQHTLTYRDPETGLAVRCVAVAWKGYPTVEWTLYFKNEGTTDTPLLESLQALDTTFQRGAEGEFVLHHHLGDKCSIDVAVHGF